MNFEALSPVAQPRKMKDLLHLPTELHRKIVLYIKRPTDLKALCLVCKTINEVAIERLYTEVTIEIAPGKAEDRDIAYSDPTLFPVGVDEYRSIHGNPGLQYIRSLRCVSRRPQELKYSPIEGKRIGALLCRIPRNRLESLSLPTIAHFEGSVESTIEYQASLRKLNLFREDNFPLEQHLQSIHFKSLPRLRSLVLPIVTSRLRVSAADILVECQNLMELEIMGEDLPADAGFLREPLSSVRSLVVRTGMNRYSTASWLAQSIYSAFSFHLLTTFTLETESKTEFMSLLDLLTGDFAENSIERKPALRNLRLRGTLDNSDSLANFLRSFAGLKTLYLDVSFKQETRVDRLFSALIHNHAPSLRELYYGLLSDIGVVPRTHDFKPLPIPVPAFREFCRRAPYLRQLAITLPKFNLDDAKRYQWAVYGELLKSIATLDQLAMLEVLTWSPWLVDSRNPRPLADFATLLLRKKKNLSPLKPCPLLSFSSHPHISPSNYHRRNPSATLPIWVFYPVQLDGQAEVTARRVRSQSVCYDEPEWKTLEYTIGNFIAAWP